MPRYAYARPRVEDEVDLEEDRRVRMARSKDKSEESDSSISYETGRVEEITSSDEEAASSEEKQSEEECSEDAESSESDSSSSEEDSDEDDEWTRAVASKSLRSVMARMSSDSDVSQYPGQERHSRARLSRKAKGKKRKQRKLPVIAERNHRRGYDDSVDQSLCETEESHDSTLDPVDSDEGYPSRQRSSQVSSDGYLYSGASSTDAFPLCPQKHRSRKHRSKGLQEQRPVRPEDSISVRHRSRHHSAGRIPRMPRGQRQQNGAWPVLTCGSPVDEQLYGMPRRGRYVEQQSTTSYTDWSSSQGTSSTGYFSTTPSSTGYFSTLPPAQEWEPSRFVNPPLRLDGMSSRLQSSQWCEGTEQGSQNLSRRSHLVNSANNFLGPTDRQARLFQAALRPEQASHSVRECAEKLDRLKVYLEEGRDLTARARGSVRPSTLPGTLRNTTAEERGVLLQYVTNRHLQGNQSQRG